MQETSLSRTDERITRIDIADEEYSDRFGFEPGTEEQKVFFRLCSAVYQCGDAARTNQAHIHRAFKDDGSILTETDLAVSDAILEKIRELYPDCNVISEEVDTRAFREGARYTFVLDPIDGTDSYSQGLPAWCVSLGILDGDRRPCGAIVFAPRFGMGTQDLFACSMPGDPRIFLNGELHSTPRHYDEPRQMLMGAKMLNYVDMRPYKGKLRVFGSSIIHMIAPAVFSNIDCSINQLCFAWDVAGAHGIIAKSGLRMCYFDGSEVEYDDSLLLERKMIRMPILVGSRECVKWMQGNLVSY